MGTSLIPLAPASPAPASPAAAPVARGGAGARRGEPPAQASDFEHLVASYAVDDDGTAPARGNERPSGKAGQAAERDVPEPKASTSGDADRTNGAPVIAHVVVDDIRVCELPVTPDPVPEDGAGFQLDGGLPASADQAAVIEDAAAESAGESTVPFEVRTVDHRPSAEARGSNEALPAMTRAQVTQMEAAPQRHVADGPAPIVPERRTTQAAPDAVGATEGPPRELEAGPEPAMDQSPPVETTAPVRDVRRPIETGGFRAVEKRQQPVGGVAEAKPAERQPIVPATTPGVAQESDDVSASPGPTETASESATLVDSRSSGPAVAERAASTPPRRDVDSKGRTTGVADPGDATFGVPPDEPDPAEATAARAVTKSQPGTTHREHLEVLAQQLRGLDRPESKEPERTGVEGQVVEAATRPAAETSMQTDVGADTTPEERPEPRPRVSAAIRSFRSIEAAFVPAEVAAPQAAVVANTFAREAANAGLEGGGVARHNATTLASSAAAAPMTVLAPTEPTGQVAFDQLLAPEVLRVPEAPMDLGPFAGEPHEQVVRAVRMQWQQGVSEARLTLRPEHLGEVTVTLKIDHGSVSATLKADTPAAADWIRSHQADLRSSLDEQGLSLKSLEVGVDPEGRRRQPAREREQDDLPRPRRRQGADLPRFDIHV